MDDMINVYTLTFQFARNYGAILQAYALYKYLENNNCNVHVIDYWPQYAEGNFRWYSSFTKKPSIKNLLLAPNFYRASLVFEKFKKKYMRFTDRCNSKADIELLPHPDVIMVGSDQVWNPVLLGEMNEVYFLDFDVDALKVSYAASAGEDSFNKTELNKYASYMKKMDQISVREDLFYKIMKNMGIRNIHHNLDPVFLLNKNEYMNIAKVKKKNRYVLTYYSDNLGLTDSLALSLSDANGKIPIYKIGKIRNNGRIKGINTPSIEEFLGLIANAEYVVTSSFHGTAFSIIFRKQFFSVKAGNRSSRLISLLNQFNMQSRYIGSSQDIEKVLNKQIDYREHEGLITKGVEESQRYISLVLESAKKR